MTSGGAFQRLELALGALGLTAASLVFVVMMDAMEFHAAALLDGRLSLGFHVIVLLVLAVAYGFVIARAVWSLVRQVLSQRSFLRALPIRSVVEIDGQPVHVFPGRSLQAFCAGLLRPAVYVSAGTLRSVSGAELRAILAHEHHHRVRRDPLRMLLARVVSDAFRPLRPLATLADRHASLADLAADEAAVRALGDVQPLASALVRFDETAAPSGGGVAPERVDHLMRHGPPDSVPAWLLGAAWLALAGIAAQVLAMVVLGVHPGVPLELMAMIAACVPAYVAARRAEAAIYYTASSA